MAVGTPLAALLPTKYKDCDVTQLFPGFRHNKVLRFSRLFGPTKRSNLPIINETNETCNKLTVEVEDPSKYIDDSPSAPGSPTINPPTETNKIEEEEEVEFFNDWRFGPARYWYDSLNFPHDKNSPLDCGFKMKQNDEPDLLSMDIDDPDESFHMISQLPWEEDIIWDGQEGNKIISKITKKCQAAGWVPSAMHRRASDFNHQVREPRMQNPIVQISQQKPGRGRADKSKQIVEESDITWFSIFPVENDDLIYSKWEEDVIWDVENMTKIPKPKLLTLDPNDENIILEIPDDTAQVQEQAIVPGRKAISQMSNKEKRELAKKSKIKFGKSGVIVESNSISPTPDELAVVKKPWNISNDEYYSYKQTPDVALKPNIGNFIQHSTPAVELRQPFFPTYMNPNRLRQFHRPTLKRYSHGALAEPIPHFVESLVKHIKKKEKQREQDRLASGGGEMFFMHSAEDLSGKDGEIIFAECSEEYPPLLNQVGMSTKIKNYMRRKASCNVEQQENELTMKYTYGEPALINSNSPFLGNLYPGETLQTIENNMYRAPIYRHQLPHTDFLVVRTREKYSIREVETIFTVGQELPIIEVPGPNSKKANNFIRDFLQVYIYRLFWKSTDEPRRIRMEDIKKAFPLHSESSIRKRLKQCADFKRTGMDSNWWVLKSASEFRLPPEAEIRTTVTPEQCCAYYSMLSAEQRLKDAGYGEKSLFAPEDEDDEELQLKIEDEVKAAPWNTTRAFISAMKHKCLLQLVGVADPTGCEEGFSYVRVPNKPLLSKEESVKEPQPKKTVTGTDADLRRLKLSKAKSMLREYGVAQKDIDSLPRWQVIHLVRELSTRQVRAGEDASSNLIKFARGNRFSIAEHQERYKEQCQRIFELQNKVLCSEEVLSTDDEESNEEDSDIEEMGKNLESMIANGKSSMDISFEREEAERKELHKWIHNDNTCSNDDSKMKKSKPDTSDEVSNQDQPPTAPAVDKILKIYRTFRDPNGREVVRIETVTKPAVVENYIRIRKTKNDEEIKLYASLGDDQQRDPKRKERKPPGRKKKIVTEPPKSAFNEIRSSYHQNVSPGGTPLATASSSPSVHDQDRSDSTSTTPAGPVVKKRKEKDGSKMRCSACGGLGHMKNNRSCPSHKLAAQVISREETDEDEESNLTAPEIIKTADMKIVINTGCLEKIQESRKRKLKFKIPLEALKKRRSTNQEQLDYLQKPDYKSTNRRPTDPLLAIAVIFEGILNELKDMPDTQLFWLPVNPKKVPDYFNIVKDPIDLQTMRKRCNEKCYTNRDEFLSDVKKLHQNSLMYNGPGHPLTLTAEKMVDSALKKVSEKSDKIEQLEKSIDM